ncbi:MAG TPA: hypothetical protein VKH82_01190, partial [Candidatus Binatia bacterium]|nr:hypothetical protein [Candidatus Binatia bacterium]
MSSSAPRTRRGDIDGASATFDDSGSGRFFEGDAEMARRVREFDWASTPIGPMADWPQSLKTIVRVML